MGGEGAEEGIGDVQTLLEMHGCPAFAGGDVIGGMASEVEADLA